MSLREARGTVGLRPLGYPPVRRKLATLSLPLAAACAATTASAPAGGDARAAVAALEAEVLAARLAAFPEEATRAGWPGADHAAVTDVRPEAVAARRAAEDRLLARARAVDAGPLADEPEGAALAALLEVLEGARAARPCREEIRDGSPGGGWLGTSIALAEVQPVRTPAQREAAVLRLRAFALRVDEEIENLREGVRRRIVATRENVERTLGLLDRLLATPPSLWPQTAPASRADDPSLRSALVAVVERELLPAAQRYRTFLSNEVLERARRAPGLLGVPEGEACYRGAVRRASSLAPEPAELHAAGLAWIEDVHARVRGLAGPSRGTRDAGAVIREVRASSGFRDEPREGAVRILWSAARRAAEGGSRLGGILPEGGFAAGWPLYAERHAEELGLDAGEAERLAALAREALAAVRLAVDPGLALFGWPRQRAIDFVVANAGLDPAAAAAEVDRLAARPGEGAAGGLGARELLRLRATAERAAGAAFDPRAFHAALLAEGPSSFARLRVRAEVRASGAGR